MSEKVEESFTLRNARREVAKYEALCASLGRAASISDTLPISLAMDIKSLYTRCKAVLDNAHEWASKVEENGW